jgi:DNA-binding protein HU-beta
VNKQELAAYVAKAAGMTATAAQEAIDATFEGITVSLQKGDEVRLVGFGTFACSARAAREGRNPQTGEALKIAASNQPKFKAGKALKDAVNAKK